MERYRFLRCKRVVDEKINGLNKIDVNTSF